jgi:hypothetical protein
VLPLAGWELGGEEVAWALTDDGLPTVLDRWSGSPDGTTDLIVDAVGVATQGATSRLGRLLAPMGVRYVVVVESDRPVPDVEDIVAAPAVLTESFGEQLDLAEVDVDEGLHVYRNEAWFPSRADVGSLDNVTIDGGYLRGAAGVDLSGSEPALADDDVINRYEGPADGDLWFSAASSDNWKLTVDGERASRVDGFGWGNAYAVESGGDATLAYEAPIGRVLLSAFQAAAWALAAYVLWRTRPRRTAG